MDLKVQLICVVFILAAFLTKVPQVHGMPGKFYNTPVTVKPWGCTVKPEIDELCQQCAKHTKAIMVYPMCCEDQDEAREFCRRYLNYGLH